MNDEENTLTEKAYRKIILGLVLGILSVGGISGSGYFRLDKFTSEDGNRVIGLISTNATSISVLSSEFNHIQTEHIHIKELIERIDKRDDKIDSIQQTMLHRMQQREKEAGLCRSQLNEHLRRHP